MAKVELHLELPIAAACWLALAAQRFALPSQGKALRCCINYACQAEDAAGLVDGIGDGGDDADSARSSTVLEVEASQIAWLQSVGGSRCDAARAAAGIVAACIARFPHVGAAASIFATIRCKLQTGAAACPGASAAKRALPASPASGGLPEWLADILVNMLSHVRSAWWEEDGKWDGGRWTKEAWRSWEEPSPREAPTPQDSAHRPDYH